MKSTTYIVLELGGKFIIIAMLADVETSRKPARNPLKSLNN
jgi:hypothetical protein